LEQTDVESAIQEGQLYLEYQPKLDMRLGRITAAEALVRWQHPIRGRVPPDEFIGVAEQNGLITKLTDLNGWRPRRSGRGIALTSFRLGYPRATEPARYRPWRDGAASHRGATQIV
jgi:hypothetical protein